MKHLVIAVLCVGCSGSTVEVDHRECRAVTTDTINALPCCDSQPFSFDLSERSRLVRYIGADPTPSDPRDAFGLGVQLRVFTDDRLDLMLAGPALRGLFYSGDWMPLPEESTRVELHNLELYSVEFAGLMWCSQ